ncbi:thiolase-like protein [Scenedesmus sp. NREL 46B-D3]|nr:thiolase-like protein [Scenedesmus sp. NREL 46B-D3]
MDRRPPFSASHAASPQQNFAASCLGLRWAVAQPQCCCAAATLTPRGRNHRLTGAVARSAPECCNMCRAGFDVMITDAHAMLVAGEELSHQVWQAAQQRLGWTAANVDLVVPHQVFKKALASAVKTAGIPPDNFVSTYPCLGNVGAASVGIALSMAEKQQRLVPGKRVALAGIGSGINCISAEIIW